MKTYEMIKWSKGFIVMTRRGVNNSERFYFKTKTAAKVSFLCGGFVFR